MGKGLRLFDTEFKRLGAAAPDPKIWACGRNPQQGGWSLGGRAAALPARLCIVCSSDSELEMGACHTDANGCAARDPHRSRQSTRPRHAPGQGTSGSQEAGATARFGAK